MFSVNAKAFLIAANVGFLANVCASAPAGAQSAGQCNCVVASVPGGGAVGSILDVGMNGNVKITGDAGYRLAAPGDNLSTGTRMIVGPSGSATVQFGGACQFVVPENQTLRVDLIEGQNCAWYDGPVRVLPTFDGNALLAITASIGAIAGAVVILNTGDDDPVSD